MDDQAACSGGPSKVARTDAASSNDALQSSGNARPTLADWKEARATIMELYIHQKRPLRDVVQILRERHNFQAR